MEKRRAESIGLNWDLIPYVGPNVFVCAALVTKQSLKIFHLSNLIYSHETFEIADTSKHYAGTM